MDVRKARPEDVETIAALSHLLWQSAGLMEHVDEVGKIISSPDSAIFVACDGKSLVGFAYCHLRCDYVEGTHASPVGYLEGILVSPTHRRRGYGLALVGACERWARSCGCTEFASDCELDGKELASFLEAAGFAETNRIICFAKGI